jgi:hypothetical protein
MQIAYAVSCKSVVEEVLFVAFAYQPVGGEPDV